MDHVHCFISSFLGFPFLEFEPKDGWGELLAWENWSDIRISLN